jgi:hypothetical protein
MGCPRLDQNAGDMPLVVIERRRPNGDIYFSCVSHDPVLAMNAFF